MSSVSHALQHELPRHSHSSQYSGKSAGAAKLEERGRNVNNRRIRKTRIGRIESEELTCFCVRWLPSSFFIVFCSITRITSSKVVHRPTLDRGGNDPSKTVGASCLSGCYGLPSSEPVILQRLIFPSLTHLNQLEISLINQTVFLDGFESRDGEGRTWPS